MSFAISSQQHDDEVAVIAVSGELDLHSAPDLKVPLLDAVEQGARYVVLDLSAVTFIDSIGLGGLVGGLKRLRAVGGALALVCADRSIVRLFEITGLDWVFPLHLKLTDALASAPCHAAS